MCLYTQKSQNPFIIIIREFYSHVKGPIDCLAHQHLSNDNSLWKNGNL